MEHNFKSIINEDLEEQQNILKSIINDIKDNIQECSNMNAEEKYKMYGLEDDEELYEEDVKNEVNKISENSTFDDYFATIANIKDYLFPSDWENIEYYEVLNEKHKNITNDIEKIEKIVNDINKKIEIIDISTSSKSCSIYITIDIKNYKKFIDNFYYTDNFIEDSFEEYDTFEIRISNHEAGSCYNEWTNESVNYNSGNIYINLNDY